MEVVKLAAKSPARCAKAPCISCPYRRDVPSGLWSEDEYVKLFAFDGSMTDQALTPAAHSVFMCHQNDGKLCAGWVGTHGADNLLALRLRPVDPSVWTYESPVKLWRSGAQAARHGMRDIDKPGKEARVLIDKLVAMQARKP